MGVQNPEPLHCKTQPRPRGWRPQRPLCFQMFFQVDIHNVVRSAPGFKTMELPRDQVALAHFRTLQNGQETFPGLVQEQEEDLNLIRGLTPKILDRVNKVIFQSSSIAHYHSHFLLLLLFMLMLLLIAHSQSSRDTFCEGVLVFMLMLVFMLILMLVFMFMLVLMLVLQGVQAARGEHCKLPLQLHRPQ